MRYREVWAALLCAAALSLGGCFTAPPMPTTQHAAVSQGKKDPKNDRESVALGGGVTLSFGAGAVIDGELEDDLVDLETQPLLLLGIPAFEWRFGVSRACDFGFDLGVARLGADYRCGVADGPWGASLSGGAYVHPLQLVGGSLRVGGDAGYSGKYFLLMLGGELSGGRYRRTLSVTERVDTDGGFDGTLGPRVLFSYYEAAAAGSLTLGVSEGRYESPHVFFSVGVEKPLNLGETTYEGCIDCDRPHTISDFDPGLRVLVIVGVAGRL